MRPERRFKPPVQIVCNGFPDILKAGIAHVAVDKDGILFGQDFCDPLVHFLRRRDIGVPEAEIVDIFAAVDGGQPVSFLKHGADRRAVCHHIFHLLRYHLLHTPFRCLLLMSQHLFLP